jgi:hypothetical protein
MSLGNIKLGTAFNKSYTHNMDFDNNGCCNTIVINFLR